MKSNICKRSISILLCLLLVISCMIISLTATSAAVLPDGYEHDFEQQGKTYENMGILEDQYDLIEPQNNRYPVISPSSLYDCSYPPLYTGTYEQVEKYFQDKGMTDGMPIVPPTKIKAEKFMAYSSYGYDEVIATINNKSVKAYMVAANAIMAGCSPEHLPVCIAFTQALSNSEYLDSLRSGKLTPMMYVNGPMARQIGIDCTQGMTTEEANIGIGRFMELALINLAGIKRTNAFGNVQPLVFSENEEVCENIGWKPHHVEQGYELNDNVITATSFSMWGNNITPATDLPDEIMKVLAWDVTEKNLGGLGSASVEENANAKRLIFITESVATALSAKYKSKDALEGALVENARRPLWMRTYAYYYANTGGALTKSFSDVYDDLKSAKSEDAKSTASPPWMNGITYANIDTVATMTKGNTNIIITGDSSRNKTQVMPGGVSVSEEIRLSNKWDSLVTSVNYNPIDMFYLTEQDHTITPPTSVPSVLVNGSYRIIDPATLTSGLTAKGTLYFDSSTNTLHYYLNSATAEATTVIDPESNASFIAYLDNLGYNSSFTVSNHKINAVSIRFSSNAKKLTTNTTALTNDSFSGMNVTIHANNKNSYAAGGLAKDGATITMSDTVTSFTADFNGDIVMGESTNAKFVKLNGTSVTIDPTVEAGATAVIGSANDDGTYRTMTFINGGDGTYTITYNTPSTISSSVSTYCLKGTFNDWAATDVFAKTDNSDIISITKELNAGTYTFKINKLATDEWYGTSSGLTINDSVYRTILNKKSDAGNITLNATGGTYEFKFEISTQKLSVYHSFNEEAETTKTVYVGVISYITDFTPTLHYWNNAIGLSGDALLTATGDTKQYSVGSSYWSDAKQTFRIYKTEIPVAASNMKTCRINGTEKDRWADEEIAYADGQVVLLFEYGGIYHNQAQSYSPSEPTEPTEEPTQEPTDPPITFPEGYYLVGTLNGNDCWTVSENRKLTENTSTSGEYMIDYSFSQNDQIKIVHFNGTNIDTWYSSGDNYKISDSEIGDCTVYFRPSGNSDWTYNYIYVAKKETPTETTTEPTTEPATTPIPGTTVTINFKSSTSYRYIPILNIGDKTYTMTSVGKIIGKNSTQTQSFCWYTVDVPITEGQNLSIAFSNKYSMYAKATIKSVSDGDIYYFGCDNLSTGKVAVDITDKPEYIRNFVKSSTFMLSNDPRETGLAITSIGGKSYKMGDVDGDNDLTIMDATKIQKSLAHMITLSEKETNLADYDIDGTDKIIDVTKIQIYLANGQ